MLTENQLKAAAKQHFDAEAVRDIGLIADTVTEMKKIKHAFNAGIPAQRGIED